jgi:hypothetical protein
MSSLQFVVTARAAARLVDPAAPWLAGAVVLWWSAAVAPQRHRLSHGLP